MWHCIHDIGSVDEYWYVLQEKMEIMKRTHPHFTDIFIMNTLVEDIQYHRFTPVKNYHRVDFLEGCWLLLCGIIFSLDQQIIFDEKDQRMSQNNMGYRTVKEICEGRASVIPISSNIHSIDSSLRKLYLLKCSSPSKITISRMCVWSWMWLLLRQKLQMKYLK